jgi:DNA-binding Lrp family transcriptional regulator
LEKGTKVTSLDVKILEQLQSDCRQSLKELSKKLKVPMSTIHDRVKRLEAGGVIKGYSAVLDPHLLGMPETSFVLVSVRHYMPDSPRALSQQEIAAEIAKFPRVQEVHVINGEWDLLLKIRGHSVKDIGLFVIDKLRGIRGVDRTLTIDSVLPTKETLEVDLGQVGNSE